jgi:hypothetical protein
MRAEPGFKVFHRLAEISVASKKLISLLACWCLTYINQLREMFIDGSQGWIRICKQTIFPLHADNRITWRGICVNSRKYCI